MKTKFFFFAMLANVAASAQVTNVTPVSANYTNKTVSFRVWWNAGSRDATHLSKVWVWVDYIAVNNNNTTSGNTWTRATIGTISGGTTSYDGNNRKGFWLEGNASTAYSATLTVQLTNLPAKFNWCAYVSDYPPNMVMDEETYYFKGTPPFILKEANETIHEITQTSMPKSNLTFVPVSITDKTECPGGLKEVIGTCPYTGTDWYADPNHKCQQRASGAQNWEAWIKDTRDNELYRIVYMPDNRWWLAQNVRYASTGSSITYTGCTPEICGRYYTQTQLNASYNGGSSGSGANKQGVCPKGWVLPVKSDIQTFMNKISATTSVAVAAIRHHAATKCGTPTDLYGWANIIGVAGNHASAGNTDEWWTNDVCFWRYDCPASTCNGCGTLQLCINAYDHEPYATRCFRQL